MKIQGLGRRRASRLGYTIDHPLPRNINNSLTHNRGDGSMRFGVKTDLEVIVVGDRKPLHTSTYDLATYAPIIYHADVKSVWYIWW